MLHVEIAPERVDWDALHSLLRSSYAYMDGRIDPPSSLHSMSTADFAKKTVGHQRVTAIAMRAGL